MLRDYLALMRPWQWYKNLLVTVPLIFGHRLLDPDSCVTIALSYAALCLASSSIYAVNDALDADADRLHPVKRNRPVASGRVSKRAAIVESIVLAAASLALAACIHGHLVPLIAALLATSYAYSVKLKSVAIVDMVAVSCNYVIRTVSGAVVLGLRVTPLLVAAPFFMALTIISGKRSAELRRLGVAAARHRKVFELYSSSFLQSVVSVSAALTLTTYVVYCVMHSRNLLLGLSIPLAALVVLRYLVIVSSAPEIAEEPHKLACDTPLLASYLLWLASVVLALYAWPIQL